MKYPIFASVIVFSLALMYAIHRTRDKEARIFQEFLDNEVKANSTRKKPLDDLAYITIPFDSLPLDIMNNDERVIECVNTLKELSQSPIVNLTGITNTELKLKYGAPNIEILSRYDQSYTILARTLNKLAACYHENGHDSEARSVLEFAVSTGIDITSAYSLLVSIYKENGQTEKIKELIPVASGLNSLNQKPILRIINEALDE